ncbi:ABC transporter permease [Dickeya fangzhongdai]|uniref:Nickel ABC transporter permease n=1 Tax=Dickeya fangzhongdai TaxID=1778540 RepID=A0A2K8QJX6_9GAMM|nr:ABC transporter permease [Dickeya fangzhongdai]ATZ93813.1 nickel ABC transporter permease [Dickeya fangzhongdai]QOH47247.1 ABC transporter permease [Dickeya fangzhongdai]QOH51553.1 ABC transporter permease [Dickeya fangzhongdai]WOY01269.1 ABC transporter permease [Dickeya fangzhongdai]WOY03540.1 ABC transporter permease [Dickeya fangzhongdai]
MSRVSSFTFFPRFAAARWRFRQPALLAGTLILLCWVLLALLAPWVAPFDPIAQDPSVSLQPPGGAYLFGTDNYGRDIFSRVVWASRIDLQISLLGVLFPFCIGTLLGALSGYLGGLTDTLVMRVIDVVLAFPFLVLMLAIIAVLGPGLMSFYIAMAMVGWVSYARLVRSQVLTLRQRDYILAARSLGYSHWRVLFVHLLPNALTSSLVFAMSDCVLVLLSGAAISYLGLGVQPPLAEWGVMVAEGQSFITTAWWMTTFPGLAIVLLAMGFSLLADGLGDRLGARP